MRTTMNDAKRFCAWAVLGLALAGFATRNVADAGEAIPYLDADGSAKTCSDYTLVSSSTNAPVVWGEPGKTTWYVAEGDLTITNATGAYANSVIVTGDVRLVLKDGCDLKVFGYKGAAICVQGDDNAFTVYAQNTNETTMGRLTAEVAYGTGSAGIGGGLAWDEGAGNITINGGHVTAKGGDSANVGGAGIGGETYQNARNIFIHGGVVISEGGKGAGIGGGWCFGGPAPGGCSNVVITGGRVIAKGGAVSAGIGGGGSSSVINGGSCDGVLITGGEVTATGGTADSGEFGSGIGGGGGGFVDDAVGGDCQNVFVCGGKLNANIGAGRGNMGSGNSSNINVSSLTSEGPSVEISATGCDVVCDRESHGITVTVKNLEYDYEVEYALSEQGPWSATQPTLVNPCDTWVFYRVKTCGFVAMTCSARVQIHPCTDPVSYLDADGSEKVCTEWIPVDSSTAAPVVWGESGKTTWYVAEGDLTIASSTEQKGVSAVVVTGDVRLVLKDGCDLKVYGYAKRGAAICVEGNDNAFTVYAQSTNEATMGKLTAEVKVSTACAGIGGTAGPDECAGNITINGGCVIARGNTTSAVGAAGIGGGYNEHARNIFIHGGVVTAEGRGSGAGIGAGKSCGVSNVVITGGRVMATGAGGAGIGGANGYFPMGTISCANVLICGGEVVAQGGQTGIGGGGEITGDAGNGGNCQDVFVLGGKVIATGSRSCGIGAGVGESREEDGVASNVFVATGMYLLADTVTPPVATVAHASDTDVADALKGKRYVSIEGPSVEISATGCDVPYDGESHGITVTVKNLEYDYEVEYALSEQGPWSATQPTLVNPCDTWAFYRVKTCGFVAMTCSARVQIHPCTDPVSYLDADGSEKVCTEWIPVDSSTAAPVVWGEPGKTTWYVAEGDLTITNATGAYADSVIVTGDVRLVLKDGCDLQVFGKLGAAICVSGESNAFTVYAQSTNETTMGKLTAAVPQERYAGRSGIGAGQSSVCNDRCGGNITVNGGLVTAQGGYCGAGIGASDGFSATNIVINGGVVTAMGGYLGAGIGAGRTTGCGSDATDISIRGGTVVAKGATGIGGGSAGYRGGSLYGLSISGGSVFAIGSMGAGIGGGSSDSGSGGAGGGCSNVVISGGRVYAEGGYDGAGIGGGRTWAGGSRCVDIAITGGCVQAYGSGSGAGIGGGGSDSGDQPGSVKDVRITGGSVLAVGGSSRAPAIGGGVDEHGTETGSVERVFVSTALTVKADGNNPPTTVIANDGGDLSESLKGKQYFTAAKEVAEDDLPDAPLDNDVDVDDPDVIKNADVPFSSYDYVAAYDGAAHTVDTNAMRAAYAAVVGEGSSVQYAVGGGTPTLPWMDVAPTFRDVVATSFWYKASAPGYYDVVHPCKVLIQPRPVTITSGTKTDFVYDGQPHSLKCIAIDCRGFVAGEGIATSNWATVTEVEEGAVDNAFDYAPLEGTKLENYDVTVVTGKIAVIHAVVVNSGEDVVAVPVDWLSDEAITNAFGADAETAAHAKTGKVDADGNELEVWHDYVAGTDPTNLESRLVAYVTWQNDVPVVTWEPALNGRWVKEGVRVYTIYGKEDVTNATWKVVAPGDESLYHFFKVGVKMAK